MWSGDLQDRVNVAIVSSLSYDYKTQRPMLDSKRSLTRAKADRMITRRYKRLQSERCAAGSKALVAKIKNLVIMPTKGHWSLEKQGEKLEKKGLFTRNCHHCEKRGNRADDCFSKAKQDGGANKSFRPNISSENNNGCFICKDRGHCENKCPHRGYKGGRASGPEALKAMMAVSSATPAVVLRAHSVTTSASQKWAVDSGATQHLTSDGTAMEDCEHANGYNNDCWRVIRGSQGLRQAGAVGQAT